MFCFACWARSSRSARFFIFILGSAEAVESMPPNKTAEANGSQSRINNKPLLDFVFWIRFVA